MADLGDPGRVTGRGPLRVWLVGFGTVGRWVGSALARPVLADGCAATVVGIANSSGFAYRADGLDPRSVADGGWPSGARVWSTAIEGMRATEADLLVEVTASPETDGEPGLSHMREALRRGIPVVTSNKWPVALHGAELAALAASQGVAFRAESTVMSGTPVLSTLTEGLAGTTPISVRGVLNATANVVLSLMAAGQSYPDALAEAQRAGLAERDPAADVAGHDTVAKLMILSALVFGRQLRRDEVACVPITGVTSEQVSEAASSGRRIRHIATLSDDGAASVRPEAVPRDDRLATVDGAANGLVYVADPVGEITIIGPGAGPRLAGQGVLSDILAVTRRRLGGGSPAGTPGPGARSR